MKKSISAVLFSLLSLTAVSAENPVILYVGDSHSYGKLGVTVEKNLSEISNKVVMHASCGATPNTWMGTLKYEKTVCGYWMKEGKTEVRLKEHQTPRFKDELARLRPDVTIIQLGTNIAAASKPQNAQASIEVMMKAVNEEGSKCIWVGPPDANSKVVTRAKVIEVNKMISDLALKNGCQYVDSLKLTKFPANNSEGIHYPPNLSTEWGVKVSAEVLKIIKTL